MANYKIPQNVVFQTAVKILAGMVQQNSYSHRAGNYISGALAIWASDIQIQLAWIRFHASKTTPPPPPTPLNVPGF